MTVLGTAPDLPPDGNREPPRGQQLLEELRARVSPAGLNVVGGAPSSAWDTRAPAQLRSQTLLAGARGMIVIGSAGSALFEQFSAAMEREPTRWMREHPLEAYVGEVLDGVDAWLLAANVRARRFEPTLRFEPVVDFMSLAELVGLGRRGPFGLLIHPEHGPWFGLRGAYLVDVELDSPPLAPSLCEGCARPCVGGQAQARSIAERTAHELAVARQRCVVGQRSQYLPRQLEYHLDFRAYVARMREVHGFEP